MLGRLADISLPVSKNINDLVPWAVHKECNNALLKMVDVKIIATSKKSRTLTTKL